MEASVEDICLSIKKIMPHELRARIYSALDVVVRYGGIDGAHHKSWVIDQMVRALTASDYQGLVAWAKDGEDGPETYSWETGIAP